jgi:hypothetical protein
MNKAIYRVPAVVALELFAPFKNSKLVMKPDILPQGTVFLDVHENYQCRSIDFIVQHESFPASAPGCQLWLINAEYESVRETIEPVVFGTSPEVETR